MNDREATLGPDVPVGILPCTKVTAARTTHRVEVRMEDLAGLAMRVLKVPAGALLDCRGVVAYGEVLSGTLAFTWEDPGSTVDAYQDHVDRGLDQRCPYSPAAGRPCTCGPPRGEAEGVIEGGALKKSRGQAGED